MRFNKLDLNLLVALDVLLTEQSITNAASRLHLSPSAVSSSLAKLRTYFNDDLLVQIGRKMEVTPRGARLHEAVRDVLLRVDSAIAIQPEFDPVSSDRVFKIFASEYTQMVLGPALMEVISLRRCSSRFEFLTLIANPHRELERGEADLLVIPATYMSPDHPTELLYEEEYVCVVWRESILAQEELNFQRYTRARHVIMHPPGTHDSYDESLTKRYGIIRQVAAETYSFASLPALVVGTNHIATVHARLAKLLAKVWPVEIRALPFELEKMKQSAQWHRYRNQDPGLVWLREVMRDAARRMDR